MNSISAQIASTVDSLNADATVSFHGEITCVTFGDGSSVMVTKDNKGTYTYENVTRYGTQVFTDVTAETILSMIANHDMLATI